MLNEQQKSNFLSNIYTKLIEKHAITSYEYEIFKEIKIEQSDKEKSLADNWNNNYKKLGQENNLNEEKMGNKINQEKIKINIEKILSYISDKKEYEFISDYFISESEPSINMNFIQKKSSSNAFDNKENGLSQNSIDTNIYDFDNINESLLNMLSKQNLTDLYSIKTFSEEIDKNSKSKSSEISYFPSFNNKKNSGIKEEDLFLPEMKKAKSYNNKIKYKNSNSGFESKEEMDKEFEEEINRQIFGYTKKMKESARNFGAQLKKDNQTLNKIEDLQDEVNDKTKKQTKRLEEFNYNIKIGFCQLMILIFTVIGAFIGTMFIIKIFPKLA